MYFKTWWLLSTGFHARGCRFRNITLVDYLIFYSFEGIATQYKSREREMKQGNHMPPKIFQDWEVITTALRSYFELDNKFIIRNYIKKFLEMIWSFQLQLLIQNDRGKNFGMTEELKIRSSNEWCGWLGVSFNELTKFRKLGIAIDIVASTGPSRNS